MIIIFIQKTKLKEATLRIIKELQIILKQILQLTIEIHFLLLIIIIIKETG